MTTVCQGIADTYGKEFGIKPVVITNAADFEDLNPNLLDENKRSIRLIHHGAAGPSRKIENMIKMMDYLDGRFELNLMLIEAWPGYLRRLKRHSKGKPNIHFLPPVPMRTLPRYLNQFDMGVYILEPTSFNFLHTLPNKFFEFIQARLGIAIGPSPEMARIVKEYDLGVVAEDFSPKALAHCLLELNDQKVNYYKLQSHKVAHFMSAEQNRKILLNLVHQVLQE
jgi:glycosyltransferase involved in cell wall biosynthesis